METRFCFKYFENACKLSQNKYGSFLNLLNGVKTTKSYIYHFHDSCVSAKLGTLYRFDPIARNSNNIKQIIVDLNILLTLFPYTIREWNKLSLEIRNSQSYSIFKKSLLKFIRTNSVFNVSDIYGIKLLTRLRVGLSHLREHKFRDNFQDTINPLFSRSLEVEYTSHFFCAAKISSPQEPIS